MRGVSIARSPSEIAKISTKPCAVIPPAEHSKATVATPSCSAATQVTVKRHYLSSWGSCVAHQREADSLPLRNVFHPSGRIPGESISRPPTPVENAAGIAPEL